MNLGIAPLDLSKIKKKNGAKSACCYSRRCHNSSRITSKTTNFVKRSEDEHPVFLYLNPAIEKFEIFSNNMKEFSSIALIESTNKQLLYQFGHVQVSFKTFVSQAQIHFNVTWCDKKKKHVAPSGALCKAGSDLLNNWISFVDLSNKTLEKGLSPIFKLLYDKINIIMSSFDILYKDIRIYSIENLFLVKNKKNINNRLMDIRRKTMKLSFKSASPLYSFSENDFINEFNETMGSLSTYISMIPNSLSMKSGSLMRDKTNLQYEVSEANKISDSVLAFKKASTLLKELIYNTNEVLTNLMDKLEFPYEFHIKFENALPKDKKKKTVTEPASSDLTIELTKD